MQVLLSGSAGYTGRGVAEVLRRRHRVRGLDVRASPAADSSVVADLADLDACRGALRDCHAIVMCHMAPNPTAYESPPPAIDANVKGTANLYHAAVEQNVRRVVLISSTGVVPKDKPSAAIGDGPYEFGDGLYVLTKIMQEALARYYFEKHQVSTCVLRPGWIVYDDDFQTKYGWKLDKYHPHLIDPRDIGSATVAALELEEPGLEAFMLGQEDSGFDLSTARQRLGWRAEYRFERLPRLPWT